MTLSKITSAVLPSVIATAALLLLARTSIITADRLVGFGSVVILGGIAALEYRLTPKTIVTR
jgi:hypothetical protein